MDQTISLFSRGQCFVGDTLETSCRVYFFLTGRLVSCSYTLYEG